MPTCCPAATNATFFLPPRCAHRANHRCVPAACLQRPTASGAWVAAPTSPDMHRQLATVGEGQPEDGEEEPLDEQQLAKVDPLSGEALAGRACCLQKRVVAAVNAPPCSTSGMQHMVEGQFFNNTPGPPTSMLGWCACACCAAQNTGSPATNASAACLCRPAGLLHMQLLERAVHLIAVAKAAPALDALLAILIRRERKQADSAAYLQAAGIQPVNQNQRAFLTPPPRRPGCCQRASSWVQVLPSRQGRGRPGGRHAGHAGSPEVRPGCPAAAGAAGCGWTTCRGCASRREHM